MPSPDGCQRAPNPMGTRLAMATADIAELHPLFTRMVVKYGPALLVYLRSMGASQADAEDAVQETFTRAYEKLPQYRPSESSFATWLRAIATHLWTDEVRRRRITRTVSLSVIHSAEDDADDIGNEPPDTRSPSLPAATPAILESAFARLPYKQHNAAMKKYDKEYRRDITCTNPENVSWARAKETLQADPDIRELGKSG